MDKKDEVGGGRYALAFFLAGPIGLGIQWLLRHRGWTATWVNVGVLAVILVAIFSTGGFETPQTNQRQQFVPPSNAEICNQLGEESASFAEVLGCDEQGSTDASGFEQELDDILADYQLNYALAVGVAALQISVDCSTIEPDPAVVECGKFIQELEAADQALASVIDRLDALVAEIPAVAPQEARDLLTGMIGALEKDHQSNVQIIAGWNEQDATKWHEGWALGAEAAEELMNLTEDALQLQ